MGEYLDSFEDKTDFVVEDKVSSFMRHDVRLLEGTNQAQEHVTFRFNVHMSGQIEQLYSKKVIYSR